MALQVENFMYSSSISHANLVSERKEKRRKFEVGNSGDEGSIEKAKEKKLDLNLEK